jgi:hypothetical protein
MDPRMDNGVVISDTRGDSTSSFNPNAELSADEVMWISDRAIAGEVSTLPLQ